MGRRIFNFILLAAMLIGAVITYDMKRKAEIAAADVAGLQAEVAREKDVLALLKAEWSLLTQPGRLQGVVEKYADYFQLAPFAPDQIATIDEIPLRPVGGADETKELLARMAASEPGKIK
ncbi:MAG: hypothetical protein NUV72_02100 [Bauldia sp.]|nr:hypothetical protein [Bauldia sp.]